MTRKKTATQLDREIAEALQSRVKLTVDDTSSSSTIAAPRLRDLAPS